ncbi:hypothetical protein V3C99_009131, partial [Haemonchus contortus]
KYTPALILSNHSVVVQADRDIIPLATLTNAVEWYTGYVVILSALTFGFDRAVMVTSLRSYSWFCNGVFKVCVVVLTWVVPVVWVLPMFDSCCRSHYYKESLELVEMEHAGSTYDAIDMIFETLFYVPVLCMLNGFSIIVLYSRWKTLHKKRLAVILGVSSTEPQLPTIASMSVLCVNNSGTDHFPYLTDRRTENREEQMLDRLEMELSFAMIAIIDGQIDFFCVLFYMLYWAGYSDYVDVDATLFYELYSYFFELGNIISPYILLAFFPRLRKEFCRRFKPNCCQSEQELFDYLPFNTF